MLVYHFCSERWGIENIKLHRLKVATIEQLNDPFELLHFGSPDTDIRRTISQYRSRIAEDVGLLCFSRAFTSPVQWAHYADRHKGLCLAFDIPDEVLTQVCYTGRRGPFDLLRFVDSDKRQRHQMMMEALNFKHSQWRYEREVRKIISLRECDQSEGKYFLDFDEIGILKQVIVGCASNLSREYLVSLLNTYNDVDVFKVRTAFNSYNIVRNRKNAMWL